MKLTQTGFSSLAKPRTYKATFDDPTKNGTDANIFKVPLGIRDFHVTTIDGGGGKTQSISINSASSIIIIGGDGGSGGGLVYQLGVVELERVMGERRSSRWW